MPNNDDNQESAHASCVSLPASHRTESSIRFESSEFVLLLIFKSGGDRMSNYPSIPYGISWLCAAARSISV